jgi:hypothetical protein
VFVGPGFALPSDAVGDGVDGAVGVGVVGWVGVGVGVGIGDGVGASDGVGVGVSGAEVSGAGVSADGEAESVAGGLDVVELGAGESVGSGSAESDADSESDGEVSDGEVSDGAGVCSGTALDVRTVVGSGSGDATPTIAVRVALGDAPDDVPSAGEPADALGDVEPGGKVTGYVTKLAVGCPLRSAGNSASALTAPGNVPSAYRCAAVTTFMTYANEWLYP